MKHSKDIGACAFAILAAACGSETGTVRVSLTAEDTITSGLSVGPDEENTKDYAVSYSKFLIAVGNVQLGRSSSGDELADETVYIADLTRVGEQGVEIAKFDDVAAGQWDKFGFETPAAGAGVKALGQVSEADVTTMADNGWTYWVEGTVEREDGAPVDFVIQTAVPTLFNDCGLDGEPGLAVVADGTATGSISIHGDHLWFNSFPTGDEGKIERRAAWIIQADMDQDGKVSTEDLASVDATEVFTTELGYSLDGAPFAIENALDFVRAQLATQGHFKGEGECIWQFEGVTGQ